MASTGEYYKKTVAKTRGPKVKGKLPSPGQNTGWGAKIWSALGGGGIDAANVAAHPDVKFKYKNPKPLRADDTRSVAGKLRDELLGRTVGGNEIREIESVSAARPSGGPKKPRAVVKKETVATAPRVSVAKTATAAPKVTPRSGFVNERAASAGYTTSAPSNAPGYTFGSASSARPKVKAAQDRLKQVQGAKHTTSGVRGLKWFNSGK